MANFTRGEIQCACVSGGGGGRDRERERKRERERGGEEGKCHGKMDR